MDETCCYIMYECSDSHFVFAALTVQMGMANIGCVEERAIWVLHPGCHGDGCVAGKIAENWVDSIQFVCVCVCGE